MVTAVGATGRGTDSNSKSNSDATAANGGGGGGGEYTGYTGNTGDGGGETSSLDFSLSTHHVLDQTSRSQHRMSMSMTFGEGDTYGGDDKSSIVMNRTQLLGINEDVGVDDNGDNSVGYGYGDGDGDGGLTLLSLKTDGGESLVH
mmetsp:Transcript_16839/g.47215  ORF Transcript_16839/g.47215 Transcript_16839/m.47215 type:complete len:145 (-) Transcript_16839:2891-3325(-)